MFKRKYATRDWHSHRSVRFTQEFNGFNYKSWRTFFLMFLFSVHVCTCLCTHATVPFWRMTWGNQFILFLPCGSVVFNSAVRAGDKHHYWVNHIAGPKQAPLINCLATRKRTRSKKIMSKITGGKPGFLQPFHNRLTFFRAFSVPENEVP